MFCLGTMAQLGHGDGPTLFASHGVCDRTGLDSLRSLLVIVYLERREYQTHRKGDKFSYYEHIIFERSSKRTERLIREVACPRNCGSFGLAQDTLRLSRSWLPCRSVIRHHKIHSMQRGHPSKLFIIHPQKRKGHRETRPTDSSSIR